MGKLIVEKDGVRGDVADIAQLFKETGVNLDQFLTTDQNPNKHIKIPGWICPVLFIAFCICCGIVYIVQCDATWLDILTFGSFCIYVCFAFCIHCIYESWGKTVLALILGCLILLISLKVLTPEKTAELVRDTTIEYIKQD